MEMCFKVAKISFIFTLLIIADVLSAQENFPSVCNNKSLKGTVSIINQACTDVSCDFSQLSQLTNVDKVDLLTALRDPFLIPIHIFFPLDVSKVEDSFDWNTIKENQARSFVKSVESFDKVTIFILARASIIGNPNHNIDLSRKRLESVRDYLLDAFSSSGSPEIKGSWLGESYLQLVPSDAQLLNLNADDFRNDQYVLNQSVTVFAYPCHVDIP